MSGGDAAYGIETGLTDESGSMCRSGGWTATSAAPVRLSWLDAGEHITHRLRAWVEALVQILPIAHVAELTGLHWHTIKRIDHRRLQT